MPRGRPPKPVATKRIEGDRSKSSRSSAPPPRDPAPVGEPPVPTNLDKVAKAEWRRVVPILRDMGLLAKSDAAILGGYCEAFSLWKRASSELSAGDLVVYSSNGSPMANPLASIKSNAANQMHKFLTEIGLSPTARARLIGAAEKPPAEDPITAASKQGAGRQPLRYTG